MRVMADATTCPRSAFAEGFLRKFRIDITIAGCFHVCIDFGISVCFGNRIGIPVTVFINPAYERCRASADGGPDMRWKIENSDADTHMVGVIWIGSVHDPLVVTRKLSRAKNKVDGAAIVDPLYRLPPRQKIFFVKGLDMRVSATNVGTWNDPHAPILRRTIGKSQPDRDKLVGF